jgi:hypothetical protein
VVLASTCRPLMAGQAERRGVVPVSVFDHRHHAADVGNPEILTVGSPSTRIRSASQPRS